MILHDLTIDQCPLLRAHSDCAVVVTAFNTAAGLYREVVEKFPPGHDLPPAVRKAAEALPKLRGQLSRERFRVGFLGVFQCGKSTLANRLFGVPTELSPAKQGAGAATSSIVARFRPTRFAGTWPAARDVPMTIRFLTVAEYTRRRDRLAEWAGLTAVEGQTEDKLIERLEARPPDRASNAGRPVLEDDVPYLRSLLRAYTQFHRQYVAAEKRTTAVPYSDREKYLNHPDIKSAGPAEVPAPLLAEAVIDLPTPNIPPELEVVDCPGLGANRSVDTYVTLDYIHRDLDGALLFLPATAPDSQQAGEILAALKTRFQDRLPARVWVVVNRMDDPDRETKLLRKQTTFDVIAQTCEKYSFPLVQVCLTCNDVIELAAGGQMTRAEALACLKLRQTGDDALLAKQVAAHPALGPAVDALLTDGGIGRLRGFINGTMAASVGDEIVRAAGRELAVLTEGLSDVKASLDKPLDRAAREAVDLWHSEIIRLLRDLDRPIADVQNRLTADRAELTAAFEKGLDADLLADMTPDQLASKIWVKTRDALQPTFDDQFPSAVSLLYDWVAGRMAASNLPTIRLAGDRGPPEEWAGYRQADRPGDWRGDRVPRFARPDALKLLAQPAGNPLSGGGYDKLIREKIRVATAEMWCVVRGRVRARLREMEEALRNKLGLDDSAT